jgi:hypothetical protein
LTGALVAVGYPSRNARRREREFVGAFRDAVFVQYDGEGTKGIGFNDVDTNVEKRTVQGLNGVRFRDAQNLVATLKGGAAKVIGVEILHL